MSTRLRLLPLAFLVWSGCMCTPPAAPEDAGSVADAGEVIDAGERADAGGQVDAGDAGELPDAGDAGESADAGDAGAPVDAGEIDAGGVDAGEIDAGGVDAGEIDAGEVDAGVDAGTDAGVLDAGCTGPVTCAAAGINCGQISDGCGQTLDCGTCTTPQTCGGGGVSGVCGSPPCVPGTCASLSARCGVVGNGCGGILDCGGCAAPQVCGAAMPNRCSVPSNCTGLCLQQVSCPGNGSTRLTGHVYAPNGVDPLPNVLVYVPNAPVQGFAPGVSCGNCSAGVSGAPLVRAVTGIDGSFTLSNVPAGANIPLVIQTGRWRRQLTVANVAACQTLALSAAQTRLPRNRTEGDIPRMAFATGAIDVLECALRKFGVQDSEFTTSTGAGRIHLYVGDGTLSIPGPGGGTFNLGGANAGAGTSSEAVLVGSLAAMSQYDLVFFPCKGGAKTRTNTELTNLVNYVNAGGRVFATHFSHAWLSTTTPFNTTAVWNVGQLAPVDQLGLIDTTFPKGAALAQWLQYVGASTVSGQLPLTKLQHDFDAVIPPAQRWLSIASPAADVHYTFNTPVGAPSVQQCGRVLYDDFHVEDHGSINQGSAYGLTFPAECSTGPMTPQEKLLEYMIFDLGSCVAADQPSCTPTTCAARGLQCGPAGDGCGGALDCGSCGTGETCGGGGVPGTCGSSCVRHTCADQNAQCGTVGDGCGGTLSCGTCPTGQACGGGGAPGLCGTGACAPQTCVAQGIECGPAGDGCGGTIQCGGCPAGLLCGAVAPGRCGSACTALTCQSRGFDCGVAGDGCGAQLDCGQCSLPQVCGADGLPNVCGGSAPR